MTNAQKLTKTANKRQSQYIVCHTCLKITQPSDVQLKLHALNNLVFLYGKRKFKLLCEL